MCTFNISINWITSNTTGKPKVIFQNSEGLFDFFKIYDKAYAEKNPIPIDGTIRAPKDPDSSIGEYYLTIRGTRELKTPTQKPWSIRPTSKNEV